MLTNIPCGAAGAAVCAPLPCAIARMPRGAAAIAARNSLRFCGSMNTFLFSVENIVHSCIPKEKRMKKLIIVFVILLACATGLSQRPGADEQNLLIIQQGPALDYAAVESNGLTFPDGVKMGLPGDLEFDTKGHLWVVSRPGNEIGRAHV